MIIKSYETPVQFLFWQDDQGEFSVAILLHGEPVVEFLVEDSDVRIPGLELLLQYAGLDLETVRTVIKTGGDYFDELEMAAKTEPTNEQTAAESGDSETAGAWIGHAQPAQRLRPTPEVREPKNPWYGWGDPRDRMSKFGRRGRALYDPDPYNPDAPDPWNPGYGSKSRAADADDQAERKDRLYDNDPL